MTKRSLGGSGAWGRNSIQRQIPRTHSTPMIPVDAFSARDEMMINYFSTPSLGASFWARYVRTSRERAPPPIATFSARWVPALGVAQALPFLMVMKTALCAVAWVCVRLLTGVLPGIRRIAADYPYLQ